MTPLSPVSQSSNNREIGPRHKSRRRLSRELALKGIYQWRMAGGTASFIEDQLREADEFIKADVKYFSNLLRGVLDQFEILRHKIQPCLDRSFDELSPIEFSILLLSTYELDFHPEIPYRAVINEGIELARSYGGTDGHKYINGVLDKLAAQMRVVEIETQAKN
tara:strand:- start:3795 stop:4286 length:492 start_codon:yes stop_codon:yes gene_type:complete